MKIQKLPNRRALTKLRTSTHKLAIETGRRTQTDRNDRLCTQCTQSKIEDEIHFLFDCPKHSDKIVRLLLHTLKIIQVSILEMRKIE